MEYNEEIFNQAEQNKNTAVKKQEVVFFCANAEEFLVEDADCFYFFNPFSVEILKSVMGRILESARTRSPMRSCAEARMCCSIISMNITAGLRL